MSWSVTVTGNTEEIGKKFDEQREQAAGWGMIPAEQEDIAAARDAAMAFATKYGRVAVNASGHWNTVSTDTGTVDPERSKFGRVSITIDAMPAKEKA